MIQARVVLLTNFISPYRVALYKEIEQRVSDFQIFVSTLMEANRAWPSNSYGLSVHLQKNLTLTRKWKHPGGFEDAIYIHIPYDTRRLLGKYKPNVIISSELGLRSLQAAIYCMFNQDCRLILWCTLSEYTEQGRGWEREILRRWLLPRADAILTNGESGARYIKRFSVPDKLIFRIGQAPRNEDFTTIALDRSASEAIHLVVVGSLIERKGLLPFIKLLISWCEAHPHSKIKLSFAGEGPLYKLISSYPCPPNLEFRFHGNINYADMPKFYTEADILVFPTLADEWGLVVNEAMAAGLPVLGSLHSQAVEELVQDGVNGWTFFPDCPEEVLRAIDRALSTERACLAEMRIAARKKALELSPISMAEGIVRAIDFVRQK